VIPRLLCRLGLWHRWTFSYNPGERGRYAPDIVCVYCRAAPSPRFLRFRLAVCRADIHRPQNLTAPPSWRRGDSFRRGRYCVWCSKEVR